jgi:hypothetical protein
LIPPRPDSESNDFFSHSANTFTKMPKPYIRELEADLIK